MFDAKRLWPWETSACGEIRDPGDDCPGERERASRGAGHSSLGYRPHHSRRGLCEAVGVMIEALKDRDPAARLDAARYLGTLGPDAQAAVKAFAGPAGRR